LSFKIAFPFAFFLLNLLISCGEGVVEIQNVSYQPRISVDGFLTPGKKVERIHVFRNFKLNQDLNNINFFTENTTVTLTDEGVGQVYNLTLHFPDTLVFDITKIEKFYEEFYYEYTADDLVIEYGKSYTLEINTIIDGKQLWTRSTTTVPKAGFQINGVNFNSLEFAQKKENGDLEIFEVTIERSPGVTYYLATIQPLDTNFNSLISNHLFAEIDSIKFREDFDNYVFDTSWIQNTPSYSGESVLRLFWGDFYFYSEYEIIVYAVDENYRKYMQTFKNVQEFDGNFHEAAFSFEGDGIGVFGSIIPDTTYVTVTR